MTRRHGCALLSAIIAVIVAVSAAIYIGVSADDRSDRDTFIAGRHHPHNSVAPALAGTWVGAWSASPSGAEPGLGAAGLAGRSVRNVVHTSVSGTSARVTLSNLYGRQPLTLTHASIAIAAEPQDGTAALDTMRRLTFGGATTVVIAPGEQVVSDAVRIALPQGSDVLVTTYAPTSSGP
ncbi:MAG: SGNH/GDSL hydrolase family protein, partial [Streptomyces sp.]|nr:SGNH/GDSL hydrolase family protein [Streptomyces sp.]